MSKETATKTWPELAMGLYDNLTGRGAEIRYEMENLVVMVPSSSDENATHAKWVLNGALKIRTQDRANG